MTSTSSEVTEYLAECRENLADLEVDLIAIERNGADVDDGHVSRAFSTAHAVRTGAEFFGLTRIGELANLVENLLVQVRSARLPLTPARVSVLLRAIDALSDLIQNPDGSDNVDIRAISAAIEGVGDDQNPARTAAQASRDRPRIRILLAEDDLACRLLLQNFLARYGDCDVAVNGREAVEAFRKAAEENRRYDLICSDILMPELNGREAISQIRAIEEEQGIPWSRGARIVMTTTVREIKEVMLCFGELCDAYITKPLNLNQLLTKMKDFDLVG